MNSLLDDVNALLKLKQGDLGRLEHIKKTLEAKQVLYISDSKYLKELTREYLKPDTDKIFKKSNPYDYPEYGNRMKNTESAKNERVSSSKDEVKAEKVDETQAEKVESIENVFCWKCGTKNPEFAEFCMYCGSSIHNVKTEQASVSTKSYSPKQIPKVKKGEGMSIGKKLLIGLGVLFVVIIVGAIAIGGIIIGSIGMAMNEEQEFKDELFEGMTDEGKAAYSSQIESCKNNMAYLQSDEAGKLYEQRCMSSVMNSIEQRKVGTNTEAVSNSKCGAGTVFDEETNSCIVG